MVEWWQHLPEKMSPVILSVGSFRIQYYGLMYILAFVLTYLLAKYRIRREQRFAAYDLEFIKNLMTYAFVGVLIGGRLGYVLFYNFGYYITRPLEIILPFDPSNNWAFTGISGMSYHGGLIGAMVGCAIFTRKNRVDYLNLSDLFFPVAPLGYTFGRIGNFINGELYGRVTTSPIGMYFKDAPNELRHPSQLYEGFFEGIVLFAILWSFRKAKLPKGWTAAGYIFGYGFFRFFIEFFREPDEHLGHVLLDVFSMGQILCLSMMGFAVAFYLYLAKRQQTEKER